MTSNDKTPKFTELSSRAFCSLTCDVMHVESRLFLASIFLTRKVINISITVALGLGSHSLVGRAHNL